MILQLQRDYESLEEPEQILFWREVEAMVEQDVLRPGIRRGDPRVMEFSVDELTVQEAREVRVYMDFALPIKKEAPNKSSPCQARPIRNHGAGSDRADRGRA